MAEYTRHQPRINHHATTVITNCEEPSRLLPQQIQALQNVQQASQNFGQTHIALVSMPTGSGKTGVIACLPYYLATAEPPYVFDKPILVIAPDLAILKQLTQELTVIEGTEKTFLIRRGIVPLDMQDNVLPQPWIITQTSEIRNEQLLRISGIVIANAQKFLAEDWENHLSDDLFRLVIVDEAHHHPAPTWQRIVNKFRNHNCPVIFFTATPYRTDRQAVLPREMSVIAHHLPLNDAVEQGIIRRTYFNELDELWPYEELPLRDAGNFLPDMLTDFQRIIPILQKIKSLLDQKHSDVPNAPHMAIAITNYTTHADHVLELWQHYYPEEPAETYYSRKSKQEKEEIMRRLRSNDLSLVIVVGMLLEGFDHPPISIAAITCNINAPIRFVQFVGRAQRIYREEGYTEDGNFQANIVTHKDYQQKENYNNFIEERFIPIIDAENADQHEAV